MTVNTITSKRQFDELLASGKVVFIDFYADWCGPCRVISPAFVDLARQHAKEGVAEFYKVNIDDVQDVAQAVGISSIPTFHVYKDNTRIDTLVGASKGALTNLITTGLSRV